MQSPCSDGGLSPWKDPFAVPAQTPSPSSHWRQRLCRALLSPRLPPRGSPYPKLDLRVRLIARLIDVAIAVAIAALLRRPEGHLLAALFLLVADALFQGQSPGKKCLGLKVVHIETRQGAGLKASVRRNALLAICPLLVSIPTAGRWIALFAALGLAIAEFFFARAHPLGMRLGDRWARTQVIDGRDVLGCAAPTARFSVLKAEQPSIDGQQAIVPTDGRVQPVPASLPPAAATPIALALSAIRRLR